MLLISILRLAGFFGLCGDCSMVLEIESGDVGRFLSASCQSLTSRLETDTERGGGILDGSDVPISDCLFSSTRWLLYHRSPLLLPARPETLAILHVKSMEVDAISKALRMQVVDEDVVEDFDLVVIGEIEAGEEEVQHGSLFAGPLVLSWCHAFQGIRNAGRGSIGVFVRIETT